MQAVRNVSQMFAQHVVHVWTHPCSLEQTRLGFMQGSISQQQGGGEPLLTTRSSGANPSPSSVIPAFSARCRSSFDSAREISSSRPRPPPPPPPPLPPRPPLLAPCLSALRSALSSSSKFPMAMALSSSNVSAIPPTLLCAQLHLASKRAQLICPVPCSKPVLVLCLGESYPCSP